MSTFAGNAPILRVVLENPFYRRRYPGEGATTAVVDTGYEGFAAVPPHIFEALSLNAMAASRRSIRTADGREVESQLALSSVILPDLHTSLDGQRGVTRTTRERRIVSRHILSVSRPGPIRFLIDI